MANANELTATVARLEERVSNHIRFVWAIIGVLSVWMAAISVALYEIHGGVKRVETAQANAPAQIVASLLEKSPESESAAANQLGAVAAILESSKIGRAKPESPVLARVEQKIAKSQQQFPNVPQVWSATGALVNFRSESTPRKFGFDPGQPCDTQIAGFGVRLTNCSVSLEELAERMSGNSVNGQPAPFTFINCLIRYSGGAIPAKRLTFINSSFSFNIPVVPPRNGILTLEQLTAANLEEPVTVILG